MGLKYDLSAYYFAAFNMASLWKIGYDFETGNSGRGVFQIFALDEFGFSSEIALFFSNRTSKNLFFYALHTLSVWVSISHSRLGAKKCSTIQLHIK